MADVSVARAVTLMGQTLPLVLARLAVHAGIAAALVVAAAMGAGFGQGIGAFGTEGFQSQAAFWGAAIGLAAVTVTVVMQRDRLLRDVAAAHAAGMVAVLGGHDLPRGRAQVEWAFDRLRDRFGDAAAQAVVSDMVAEVVREAVRALAQPATPPDGAGGSLRDRAGRVLLRTAEGKVPLLVLALAMAAPGDNPWASLRAALAQLATHAGPVLRLAARLRLAGWAAAAAVFGLMLTPGAAIAALLPGEPAGAGLVFAGILAWAVKGALIDPLLDGCLLPPVLDMAAGPGAAEDGHLRLSKMSATFRHMGELAEVWMPSRLRIAPRS
jgi:hypothetical protein